MGFSHIFGCMLCGSKRRQSIEGARPVYEVDLKRARTATKDSQETFDTDYTHTTHDAECESVYEKEAVVEVSSVKSNRALIVASKRCYDIVEEPFPELQNEDEIVISSRAVGLNPIDWKSVDYNFCLPEFPWITGREMAGVVEKIGSNVKGFQVGDRVWTSTYYKDRRAGCFQQYVTVPQHTVCHIPGNLDFESAACLGVAGLTSAMALWRWLQIPMSKEHASSMMSTDGYLLVWGGSAVTAQFGIQLAIRSGVRVIAVTSAKTKPLAESLGATHVVARDGKTNEELVAEIRAIGGDNITRAIDLVGTETANYCLQALSTTQPCLFAPLAMISSKAVVPENITVETVEMKQFVLNPQSQIYAIELNRLVHENQIVLPAMEVVSGGLEAIQPGLERVKKGDMAGKKMVVSFS